MPAGFFGKTGTGTLFFFPVKDTPEWGEGCVPTAQVERTTAKRLTHLLWDSYAEEGAEVLHQLRILLAFLGPENQPVQLIAEGLDKELVQLNKTRADLKGEYLFSLQEDTVVEPESRLVYFLEDFESPKLLPNSLCPKFDESKQKWVVPDPGMTQPLALTASSLEEDPEVMFGDLMWVGVRMEMAGPRATPRYPTCPPPSPTLPPSLAFRSKVARAWA